MLDDWLGLENATNARDVGGYPTTDGRRVRRGVLYRADALNQLSATDLLILAELRLACVVDLRHATEIELAGADRLPVPPPARVVSLPLLDPDHDVFLTVNSALTGEITPATLVTLSDGGGAELMRAVYRWFVSAPIAREGFATAIRLISSGTALPMLFHCTLGKDRTGWLAAVVLRVLGVDPALVVEDYLRSNDLTAVGAAFLLGAAATRIDDPSLLIPLLEARAEYLAEAFAEADRAYGSFDGYLRRGLDLDGPTLDALRRHLLE